MITKAIKENTVLFSLFSIAFILRLIFSIEKEFYPDELYGLVASTNIFKSGYAAQPSGSYYVLGGPIIYFHAVLIKLFSFTEGFVRLPGVISSILGLWLFYKIAYLIFDKKTALLALFLIAIDIDLITWGAAYTKPYSVTPTLVLFVLYLLINREVKLNANSLLLIVSLIIIGVWIHPLFVLFVPGFALTFIIITPKPKLKYIIGNTAILTAGVLGILFTNYHFSPGLSTAATQVVKDQASLPLTIGHIFNLFISIIAPADFSSNVIKKLLIIPYLSVLLASFFHFANHGLKNFKHTRKTSMIFALCSFLILGLSLHMFLPSYHYSYILPLMPIFYLLASAGLISLLRGEWLTTIIGTVKTERTDRFKFSIIATWTFILLATFISAGNYVKEIENEGWINPYSYVKKHWQNGDVILHSNALTYAFATGKNPTMYYYTEHPGIGIHRMNDEIKDNFANASWIGDSLALKKVIQQHKRVWFISQPGSDYNNIHFKNTHHIIESELTPIYKYKNFIVYLKDN